MKVRIAIAWILVMSAMGCHPARHNLPPADRLFEPGPGVGGPGPGVLPPSMPTYHTLPIGQPPEAFTPQRTVQVLFSAGNNMAGMQVRWDVTGSGQFDSLPLVVPGRQNFPEGGIYRVKITNIPGHEGEERYPTLEIGPTTPRTEAFLAHNAIPIQFTNEDFDQVAASNFVTKVIYLPDPEFQELALAGVETLVSTRLDPGVDPIVEADRRGSILAIIRMGNKDVEMPAMGANGDEARRGGVRRAAFAAPSAMPVSPLSPNGPMSPNGPNAMYHGPGNVRPVSMSPGIPPGMLPPSMAGMTPNTVGPNAMGPAMIGPTGLIPNYISGVTAPQYGMTMSGTPIGLPGPPHIPLGGPAGLQKHVMKNHTHMHLPKPTKKLQIDVKQQPGFSYPQPANRVKIHEQHISPPLNYGQTHHNKYQYVP